MNERVRKCEVQEYERVRESKRVQEYETVRESKRVSECENERESDSE